MTEQEILNKVGIEQISIAKKDCKYPELVKFADEKISLTESGNSNWNAEEINDVLRFTGSERIQFYDILGVVNKAICKLGKCISKQHLLDNKHRFRKSRDAGTYFRADVLLEIERIKNQ